MLNFDMTLIYIQLLKLPHNHVFVVLNYCGIIRILGRLIFADICGKPFPMNLHPWINQIWNYFLTETENWCIHQIKSPQIRKNTQSIKNWLPRIKMIPQLSRYWGSRNSTQGSAVFCKPIGQCWRLTLASAELPVR